MSQRRAFFKRVGALAGAVWAGAGPRASSTASAQTKRAVNLPVDTPDLPKLPYKMVDGWKEFQLTAEVVETEFVPGRKVHAWGFNGSIPGPTIEVNQGDKVRVVFENRLPEMTAVHWHGFEVPMEMDGSVGLGQDPVPPGGKFVYQWELHQAGTFFYHSHFAMQEMMGMIGLFIMHPKQAFEPACDRDFALVLQEWALLPNNTVPNTLSMEFNWLTFNGKSGPDTTPMIVKQGERVRIRLVNMGMDHHPIHLHGHQFTVTGTEAGRSPRAAWVEENTVIVGVAQARDIEFEAKYLGDWMLHCHLPHHMMNQMVSMVGPMMHSGHALGTGAGMEEGMGMIAQGHALSDDLGPSLGRGLGMAADAERGTSNLVSQAAGAPAAGGYSCPHHPEVRQSGPGQCPKCKMDLVKPAAPAAAESYSCPHHPEVRQSGPGQCPKCKMELVKPAAPAAAESYSCPHHPEVRQSGPGQCPKCKMELVKSGSQPAAHAGHGAGDPAMDMYPKVDPEKQKVPGYPQDMWMPEDEKYNWKPENSGLRRGWSGAMMGMMTLVRVVSPEMYDKIAALQKEKPSRPVPPAPGHQHHGN